MVNAFDPGTYRYDVPEKKPPEYGGRRTVTTRAEASHFGVCERDLVVGFAVALITALCV